ncbi:MAG: DUF917 domain-containing protein [Zestosphaera sp.]
MWSIKSIEDARKLVLGATILGTGGGGDPSEGLRLLSKALEEVGSVMIVGLDELPEDSLMVVPYYVGSIAPGLKSKKPVKVSDPISKAVETLESLLGVKASAVVSSEMGGANTSVALSIGARLNLPAVDGDLLGRAAPELHQCTVHIFGVPMYPSAIVSESGDVVIVKEYADIDDYESIARYMSVLSGRFVAVVDTPLSKKTAEKVVVKETVTLAYRLGDAVLSAREERVNPVERVAEILNGWVVFRGVVEKYVWRNEGGFLKGEAILRGVESFTGLTLKSWIMNEHIMVWLNNEPLVMPPDLFTLLRDDGEPVTNTELREGMSVNGVAAKAPAMWRTLEGLKFFGPRHFGFEYDYVPVEELVKRLSVR